MNTKEIREGLGLSKAKFAEKLEVQWTTVDRWEKGTVKPRDNMCKKILALKEGVSVVRNIDKEELVQITLYLKKDELKRLLALGFS